MATNYPTNLDTLTNPSSGDKLNSPSHSEQHANANDAIEALQAKVGANSSGVTTSHDYKLSGVTGSDKAASVDGTETLTNKTLTSPTLTSPSFSTIENSGTLTLPTGAQTIVGRDTTDTLTNKTLTSPTLNSPVLNGSLSGTAFLDEDNLISDSATAVASQQSIKAYVDNAVTSGQPDTWSPGNIIINLIRYTDEFFRNGVGGTGTSMRIVTQNSGGLMNLIDIDSSTWTDADNIANGWVISSGYMYGLLEDTGTSPDTFRVYRYDISDITAAGTQMSFAGATTLSTTNSAIKMASDGTNFYFTFEAGNSANEYDIAKYTLSGTTLTYDSTITLSDSANFGGYYIVNNVGDIYTFSSNVLKRYNSSGTLQETSDSFVGQIELINFAQTLYVGSLANENYVKIL